MIGTIDVEICAANPQAPLYPLRAFVNSPSTLRLRNVPRKIGAWVITAVHIAAHYPTDEITTAQCVQTGGVWVGTLAGCGTAGTSTQGYTVFADGIDEHGNPVQGYVLGKGDVEIIAADGTITPTETTHYVHLLSAASATPKDGDMYPDGSGYKVVQNGEAHALGMTSADVSALISAHDEHGADDEITLPYLSNVLFQQDEPSPNGRRDTPTGTKDLRWKLDTIDGALSALSSKSGDFLPLSGGEMSGTISAASGVDTISWGVDGAILASAPGVYVYAGEETYLFNCGLGDTPYDVMRRAEVDALLGDISTLIHNI